MVHRQLIIHTQDHRMWLGDQAQEGLILVSFREVNRYHTTRCLPKISTSKADPNL